MSSADKERDNQASNSEGSDVAHCDDLKINPKQFGLSLAVAIILSKKV